MAHQEKLQALREFVLTHPELVDMNDWFGYSDDDDCRLDADALQTGRYPECGTVGCLAGWACMLNGMIPEIDGAGYFSGRVIDPVTSGTQSAGQAAQSILGLSDNESYQMFYCGRHEITEVIDHLMAGESPIRYTA